MEGILRFKWVGLGNKNSLKYRKIPIISPGLIFVQKAFLLGLFSGELIFDFFSEGLVIGSNFAFQNGIGFSKTAKNTKITT